MSGLILVVDDDPGIRASLSQCFLSSGFAVQVASNGEEALAAVPSLRPNLMVLDVMMPGLDGFSVVRRLRRDNQRLPIVLLTARDAVDDRVAGLEAGANDYLPKPFAFSELLARVKVCLRRAPAVNEGVLIFGDLSLDPGSRDVRRGERALALTPTEFDLLRYLLQHPRQALSRQRIFESVWGYPYDGESKVIDIYIGYLRAKLESDGSPRLIQTLRGFGYSLRDEV